MSHKNQMIEAARDELRARGVKYREEKTRDGHYKVFVEGSPLVIVISGHKRDRDPRLVHIVRSDIRRAIARRVTP